MGIKGLGKQYFKALILIAAVFTVVVFSACTKKKEKWYNYAPNGENFSIDFPKRPTESKALLRMPWGDLIRKKAVSTQTDEDEHNLNYTLIYTLYPDASPIKSTNSPGRNKEILTKMMNDAVDAAEGKLRDVKDIELNGYPCKEFTIDVLSKRNQGTSVINRFLLAKSTLYMMEVTSKRGEEKNESTDRFLNSITF